MSGRNGDQQRSVNSAVKKAKNEWMQEKARAVGMLSSGSHGSMWKSLRGIAAWEGRLETSEDQDHQESKWRSL